MLNLSKKILVAIDGSPESDKAAEEAVRLAAASGTRFKSKVYAVMVLSNLRSASYADFLPAVPVTEQPDWEEKRSRYFYVVEKAAADTGVTLESLVVYGDAADELMRLADEHQCDVIVLGSSGKGRVRRALLGSVSARVSMQARCSVYIVR